MTRQYDDTPFFPTAKSAIDPHMLDDTMTPKRCVCELTDNGFDARARLVKHIIIPGVRYICDDDGCGSDDIDRLIRIGETAAHDAVTAAYDVRAGMFGVGGKAATIKLSFGGKAVYVTIQGGVKRGATADWAWMRKNNRCLITGKFDDYTTEPDGTRIIVEPCPKKWDVAGIRDQLGFEYTHTLKDHRIQIIVGDQTYEVRPWEPPPLLHPCRLDFEFPGGEDGEVLRVRGRVGLVEQWPPGKKRHGWHGRFAHRVSISSRKPEIIAGESGLNLYGEFGLPPEWRNINLTKDNIGQDADEFWKIVSEQSLPVINLAKRAKVRLDVNHLGQQVSEILSTTVGGFREKRRPRNAAPEPRDRSEPGVPTGRRRTNLRELQPGGDLGPAAGGSRAPITFNFGESETPIEVTLYRGTAHILFSDSAPLVADLQRVDKATLVPMVALAFCRAVADERCQVTFGFDADATWEAMLARVLDNIPVQDSRPVLKIISSS